MTQAGSNSNTRQPEGLTNPRESNAVRPLALLLIISVIIRAFLASWVELGTDEAYYWTFAKYPDWSHFDHPGMVGWVIQLFTLNLLCDSEFFMRLASVVFMTINTWLMYRIGRELKDQATGLWSALLYSASIYAFIITGIFILPDTPLSLFWILSFWMFVKYVKQHRPKHLLLAGLYIGLGILSKYTAAFLWLGFLIYILCFDRKQFRSPWLYLALFLSALCCLPIVVWNLQNDFVSFRFHGGRVGLFGPLTFGNFGKEFFGEFLYNNPVNVVVTIIAIVAAFRKKLSLDLGIQRLILLTALPMIGLFLLFSLTHSTLPHWSGPAYVLLIPLSAVWINSLEIHKTKRIVTAALCILVITLVLGVAEIKTGFIPLDHHTESTELGHDDVTLDLYGWRQAGEKFAEVHAQEIANGNMQPDDPIIGNKWFPTASFHYYLARPLHLNVLGFGLLENTHKYLWINDEVGGFEIGKNYWYLADSRYFMDPESVYKYSNFLKIKHIKTIPIERNGKVARNIFVYECRHLNYIPELN